MTTTAKFNLFALHKQLELKNGKRYSWRSISRATGLHENTVANVVHNRTQQVKLQTLTALMDFFDAEGMPIEIGDFFVVERDG